MTETTHPAELGEEIKPSALGDDPIKHALFWLQGALACKEFRWDPDQYECAAAACKEAVRLVVAEPDVVHVDAFAWDSFVRDYDRYNSGEPKFPFSELRQSLAAVISSATPPAAKEVAEPVAVVIADGAWKKLAFCSHDIRKAPPVGTKLYATPAAQAATPAAVGDVLDELHRALCGIGVIERKDGYELIRRESVLDLLDRRRTAISTTPGAQT